MNIKPIKHTNVHGKEQYYLEISNSKQNYLLSVGLKTYNTVKEMSAQIELPLEPKPESNVQPKNPVLK